MKTKNMNAETAALLYLYTSAKTEIEELKKKVCLLIDRPEKEGVNLTIRCHLQNGVSLDIIDLSREISTSSVVSIINILLRDIHIKMKRLENTLLEL
jgi:hypothetical protein